MRAARHARFDDRDAATRYRAARARFGWGVLGAGLLAALPIVVATA